MTPLLDTDFILPSFEDICKLQCTTIHHIPAKSRPAFAQVLSATLRSVLSMNDERSWLKLFLSPSVFFHHPSAEDVIISQCLLSIFATYGLKDDMMPFGNVPLIRPHLEIVILSNAAQGKVSPLPYPLPGRGCMAKLAKLSPLQVLPPTRMLHGNCCSPNTPRELLLLHHQLRLWVPTFSPQTLTCCQS